MTTKSSIWGFVGELASTNFGSTWNLRFSAARRGPTTCVWEDAAEPWSPICAVTYSYDRRWGRGAST